MANTYTLIEGKTLSSTTVSVTFSSIPQTYTDLVLKVSGRVTGTGTDLNLNVLLNNNNTNYTVRGLANLGSSTILSYNTTVDPGYIGQVTAATAVANTFGNAEMYIPNYAGSTNKSYSVDNNASTTVQNRLDFIAGSWSNTAAVTSLVVRTNNGTSFLTNSTFYLYGINKQ